MRFKFPSTFLWGAALSSYQCEGQNFNTDWFLWEKEHALEEAGDACRHYDLFEQDFEIAAKLNLNSLRISIEWARIFPQSETIDEKELRHYHRVMDSLASFGLKPMVTLHHFTNPIWFYKQGGWLKAKNIDFFIKYVNTTVESFKDKVQYWFVFNEPLVYLFKGFIEGAWPPGTRSLSDAKKALENITSAYLICYDEIKRIYKQSSSQVYVSLAKNLRIFESCPYLNFGLNNFSAFMRSRFFNFSILERLHKKGYLDFLAINYYCKEYSAFSGLAGKDCGHTDHKERKNYLGWYVYPQGLYELLKKLKRFNLPVIITENGTPESDNKLYLDYLISHLKSIVKAITEGVDVRGYLWWSLLDNFEWDKGFGPRFGLTHVDYNTFERTIKPFAVDFSNICKNNALSQDGY